MGEHRAAKAIPNRRCWFDSNRVVDMDGELVWSFSAGLKNRRTQFDSETIRCNASVAQLVERKPEELGVAGSIPARSTMAP